MWPRSSRRSLVLVTTVLPALGAVAADGDMPLSHVSTNVNRVSVNARFGLNISAKFKSVSTGPLTAAANTSEAAGSTT